ncbi:hypothetical protein HEP84_56610 [Streptomyces sp. RLB1-33]
MRFGILGPLEIRTTDGSPWTPAAPAPARCSPCSSWMRAGPSPWSG